MIGEALARTATARAETDRRGAASSDAAPRSPLRLIWSADGSDAPASLEPGAAPYLVAFHRGYMLGMAGRTEKAIAQFRKAVALKPDFAAAYHNLGETLRQSGQLSDAIEAFHEALKIKPDDPETYDNLGVALGENGELPAAIAAHRKAIELKPDFALAHYNVGGSLGNAGQFPSAIEAYKRAVELRPDFAEAYVGLGVGFRHTGEFFAAIEAFHKALELKPNYAHALVNLGSAFGEAREFAASAEVFRQVVHLWPDFSEAYFNLGVSLLETGQVPGAIAAFREAVRLQPDYPMAFYSLGFALSRDGQTILAIDNFREAVRLQPDYAAAHYSLGVALSQNGQYSAAVVSFREALRGVADKDDRDKLEVSIRELGEKIAVSLDATKNLLSLLPHKNYNIDMPNNLPDLETTLRAAAYHLGRPLATIRAQLGVDAAANATTKRRAKVAGGSNDLNLSPSQVVAVIENSTLGRLRRRYATLLEKNANLPDQLSEKQAREAAQLWSTYRALQDRLAKVGMEPLQPDRRVSDANSRSVTFYRNRKVELSKAVS